MTSKTEIRDLNIHMVDKSEEPSVQNMRRMDRSVSSIMHKSREMKLSLTGNFDALKTIEQMTDLMHPVGYYERIILDFSDASRVKPVELYCLFAELAALPRFNHVEICIEGLQFNYRIGKS